MQKIATLFLILYCLSSFTLAGQSDFRKDLKENDPVLKGTKYEERLEQHDSFLKKAIQKQDTLRQLYGNLYLFIDFLKVYDYPKASQYLLVAEDIAETSGRPSWKGTVSHFRGNFYVLLKDNEEKAIVAYTKAAKFCGEVGDSLCVAQSWEQLGAAYNLLEEFEQAKSYYKKAIPVLERHGEDKHLASVNNNYANYLLMTNQAADAIPYHQRAIELYKKIDNLRARSKAMNNLAGDYRVLKQYDKAIKAYEECIDFNHEHELTANKISNYRGLNKLYDSLSNYALAYDYSVKYFLLKDSIVGKRTQQKIADLEQKYEGEKTALEIQKGETALATSQQKLQLWIGLFLLGLALAAIGLWRWYHQRAQAKKEQIENKENLNRLTKLLIEKNYLLTTLEDQLGDKTQLAQENATADFQENLYNQRILTDEDWSAFKVYFEKTYPKYLQRVRTSFSTLSEAEERLFLFIKLNLTRKEMAAILGISADSVKKTRYRLRKRLELESEDSLEDFVQQF